MTLKRLRLAILTILWLLSGAAGFAGSGGDFEKSSNALKKAIRGEKISWSDIHTDYNTEHRYMGSANLALGSNPAWGIDALRRGDTKVVNEVLDWYEYLSGTPLHQNEALNSLSWYRVRIIDGTYAGALLAELAGRHPLAEKLLLRTRADVGHFFLGSWRGDVRSLVADNPKPINRPHVLVADGPPRRVKGGVGVPSLAWAGMRGWYRWPGPGGNTGNFRAVEQDDFRIIIAQALGLPHVGANKGSNFARIRSRLTSMPPWGLSPQDVAAARAFLANPEDPALARVIYGWTLEALSDCAVHYVHWQDGSIEAFGNFHDSSNGQRVIDTIDRNGIRRVTSPDNGQRGGSADAKKNHQSSQTVEYPDRLVASWISGEGEAVTVPRPIGTSIAWRADYTTGGPPTFWPSGGTPPPHPAPVRPPEPRRRKPWWEFW